MMMFRATLGLLCCSFAALSASGPRPVDIKERVSGAEQVVVATAQNVRAQWRRNLHGDRLIVTTAQLRVEETIKGTPAATIVLDLEGGTLDGVTLRVSDLPEIMPGERAVFLLDRGPESSHVPHLRGLGILKLDNQNRVLDSGLHLDDVRRAAR